MQKIIDIEQKTDEELVGMVLENKENYLYLMERYEQRLLRFLMSITRLERREDYEDILQNAFLKAYLNIRGYDRSLKFSSWIYRIVHNEMIDHVRKKKSKASHISLDDESNPDAGKLLDVLRDTTDLPEEMDQKLLSAKVKNVLNTLPEDYREVLVLQYFEDKDYREISDILQKPMGTVATLINRAKKIAKDKFAAMMRGKY